MKKLTMICMSALLMLAVSCKKDKKDEIENAGSGFRATVESHEGAGKTHLENLAVKWDSGDAILVKSNSCPDPRGFITQESGDRVNFDANETLPTNFYAPPYTGYYPADMFDDDQLKLPATQQYAGNSTFASGANPMAAFSSSTTLPFKNICGVLKLQLHNNSGSPCNVANITITSNKEGEKLYGTGTVSIDGSGIPSLGTLSNGGSTLTLNCNGEAMSTSSSSPSIYFFVVPVGTLGESFTVKVTDSNGKVWSKTATATQNTIARSKITAMPELAVTTKPVFTVDANGTTVEFAPGNLWYGKADGEETAAFHFEANQWSTTPASDGTWDPSHVSHFKWSDKDNAVTSDYNYNDELFCASNFTVTGDSHNDWRTLSYDEWNYLLSINPEEWEQQEGYGREDALKLSKWSAVKFGESGPTVNGLIIMPDGWEGTLDATTDYTTWQSLESSGAVFLPAAGRRYGTDVYDVGSVGLYWSSTPYGSGSAYYVYFGSGSVYAGDNYRGLGYAVRLVR